MISTKFDGEKKIWLEKKMKKKLKFSLHDSCSRHELIVETRRARGRKFFIRCVFRIFLWNFYIHPLRVAMTMKRKGKFQSRFVCDSCCAAVGTCVVEGRKIWVFISSFSFTDMVCALSLSLSLCVVLVRDFGVRSSRRCVCWSQASTRPRPAQEKFVEKSMNFLFLLLTLLVI